MRKSIVLAADNAYLIQLETTIKSILYHNQDVDFYILNSDIAPEWFKLLAKKNDSCEFYYSQCPFEQRDI